MKTMCKTYKKSSILNKLNSFLQFGYSHYNIYYMLATSLMFNSTFTDTSTLLKWQHVETSKNFQYNDVEKFSFEACQMCTRCFWYFYLCELNCLSCKLINWSIIIIIEQQMLFRSHCDENQLQVLCFFHVISSLPVWCSSQMFCCEIY